MNKHVKGILTADAFRTNWQGHRHLTRRIIEAFPVDQLFTFTAASPMRPFGELAWECLDVAEYTLNGLVTDAWPTPDMGGQNPQDKRALLAAWDALTERIDAELPTVPVHRYAEEKALFWGTMTAFTAVIYAVDNEIHHRGQGYVYLRALGIEPPAFYDRASITPVGA